MALPLAGIAANLLLGAAIAGVGLFIGGGSKKPSSPTPKSTSRSSPVRGPAPFLKTAAPQNNTNVAIEAATQPSQGIQITESLRPASPQPLAKPETVKEKADSAASEIQRLPVFTPTAPTLTTKNYSSQRREDVKKTKAGEQQLRNPLAIDKDATSSVIQSNLPSIGVSASGTNIANTGPSPIKKGNKNAR